MNAKTKIIDAILKREGGYVNDLKDSGGETNFGITKKVARAFGYTGEIKNLPESLAREIYEANYLTPIMFDDIEAMAPTVAELMADIAVNMGIVRAGDFFQSLLNVFNNEGRYYADIKIDGVIGKRTIAAFDAYLTKRGSTGAALFKYALQCMQGSFYIELAGRREKDERFITGWLTRSKAA